MALVNPFPALRPQPELAVRICELPYDVMSTEEARTLAAGNPLSFLHVSKPEIDLPPETDPYAPEVYARGAANFQHLIATGALRQDATPGFYLYRQVMGGHSQIGLVAVASCREYLDGDIRRHELTRVDKEDDRVRHLEALNAQTGPAFLVYRADPAVDQWVAARTARPPAVDFTASDGIRHSAWVVAEPADVEFVRSAFAKIPRLYIADGHHRSAAAARVFQSRNGAGASAWFLAVIFPHNQLQILPYHRVVKDLNGLTPAEFLARLREVGDVTVANNPAPASKHEVTLYLAGRWHALRFRPERVAGLTGVAALDVSLLQQWVLAPLLGIENPRTSERISFVGGIRGTPELERLVNRGEWAGAFAMFPTDIADLLAIADAGGIMPPKSTWFEPKLRDGLFSHRL
jgi:uncharacterized protein (DUF1015 family)